MEAKRRRTLSTPPPSAGGISWVLGDNDLLREILLRLAFPTRSALGGSPLRSPSSSRCCQLPQPPALVAVPRRASFSLDAYGSLSPRVIVFISLYHPDDKHRRGMHIPLHPARGMVTVPPLPAMPHEDGASRNFGELLLSKECGDGPSYFWLSMQWNRELKATVHVYMLQDGIWHMHTSATTQLSILILRRSIILLVGHMIYMAASLSSILVLDLASSSFFRIELPGGLTYNNGDIALSRANDSGVYVIHLKNLQLCIWLHIGVNGSVGDWLLVNTICLRDI